MNYTYIVAESGNHFRCLSVKNHVLTAKRISCKPPVKEALLALARREDSGKEIRERLEER